MQKQYSAQEPYIRRLDLWAADGTYSNHRIPGMLVTDRGTLLVYCEARRSAGDWALMDILLQRSTDGGEHFDAPLVLASGTEQHPTVNNPVMMQDKNGRIHLLYCEDYSTKGGRVLRRYSDDDGLSWSAPIDITHFTAPQDRTCFALGPGHGICLANGTLLVPVWLVPACYDLPSRKHGPAVVTTFTSRDNGESWQLGDLLWTNAQIVSPNETTAAELSDGRVYLNIRSQAGYRAHAYSVDGSTNWQNYGPDLTLNDARCCGSVTTLDGGDGRMLLFGNCASHERDHVTVRASLDGGSTWPIARLIDETRGGYVEIAADPQSGRIYLLYEEDYGAKCHLARFDLDWLTSK